MAIAAEIVLPMSLASAVARVLAILHGTTTLIFLTYQALRKQRTQKGRSQVDDKLTKEGE